jgi:hypothetical protein
VRDHNGNNYCLIFPNIGLNLEYAIGNDEIDVVDDAEKYISEYIY